MKPITKITVLEHSACTGCGVCVNGCPNGSIIMQADEKGFLFPTIKKDTCFDCGKCGQICPVLSPTDDSDTKKMPDVYAAWSLDVAVRFQSTSGGIFTELAKCILKQHGFVVGAEYTENHMVAHCLIDAEDQIPRLRQSKYIQSRTGTIYQEVKIALQTQKPVLFVGTPCQCAALKNFTGSAYQNLYLCDFICRGVNAPVVYQKYLEELEQQYHSRVKTIRFKDKTYGWNHFGTKITFENGQEYFKDRDTDPFMYGYIKKNLNLYIRDSCSQCKFKGVSRPVDLTLGDFWGVKLKESSDDMKNGVSVVLIHSKKGEELFNAIAKNIYQEEKQLADVLPGNRCLEESVIYERNCSKDFWDILKASKKFLKTIDIFMTGDYYG